MQPWHMQVLSNHSTSHPNEFLIHRERLMGESACYLLFMIKLQDWQEKVPVAYFLWSSYDWQKEPLLFSKVTWKGHCGITVQLISLIPEA